MYYELFSILSQYVDKQTLCTMYESLNNEVEVKKEMMKMINCRRDIIPNPISIMVSNKYILKYHEIEFVFSIDGNDFSCDDKSLIGKICLDKKLMIIKEVNTHLRKLISILTTLKDNIIELNANTWRIVFASDIKMTLTNLSSRLQPFLQQLRPMRMACPIGSMKQIEVNDICKFTTFYNKFIIFQRQ